MSSYLIIAERERNARKSSESRGEKKLEILVTKTDRECRKNIESDTSFDFSFSHSKIIINDAYQLLLSQ